jgi:hypothetical protein
MLDRKQAARLKRAVERLGMAERDYSWLGSRDPEEHPAIEKGLEAARARLWAVVRGLMEEAREAGRKAVWDEIEAEENENIELDMMPD